MVFGRLKHDVWVQNPPYSNAARDSQRPRLSDWNQCIRTEMDLENDLVSVAGHGWSGEPGTAMTFHWPCAP